MPDKTDLVLIVFRPSGAARALELGLAGRAFSPVTVVCPPGTLKTKVKSSLANQSVVIVLWDADDPENGPEFWEPDYRTRPGSKLILVRRDPTDESVEIIQHGKAPVLASGYDWIDLVASIAAAVAPISEAAAEPISEEAAADQEERKSGFDGHPAASVDLDPFAEPDDSDQTVIRPSPGGRRAHVESPPRVGDGKLSNLNEIEPKDGSILWTMPEHMRVAKRDRVEVRLGDAEVFEAQLRAGLKGRGVPQIDSLEVTSLMRVRLVADDKDFSVKALNSADQYLRAAAVARWDFDVTPLRSGHRVLRVLVAMRMKVVNQEELVDLPSYEREVHVAVAPLHAAGLFLGDNWKWVATAVVFPAVAWAATKTDLGASLLHQVGFGKP